jgi:enamine deaminase RidA (YjgF/YER057c/UK114 family)
MSGRTERGAKDRYAVHFFAQGSVGLSGAGVRQERTFSMRANGFAFISATPPVDMVTGEMARGDIEARTEASPKALKHCLEAAGTSLDKVAMVRIHAPASTTQSTGSMRRILRSTPRRAVSCGWRRGRWSLISRSNVWRWREGECLEHELTFVEEDISSYGRRLCPIGMTLPDLRSKGRAQKSQRYTLMQAVSVSYTLYASGSIPFEEQGNQ